MRAAKPRSRRPRRYVSGNPQYADSAAYAGRFRALQARALASLRSRVQAVLRHAAEQARRPASGQAPSGCICALSSLRPLSARQEKFK